MSADFAIRAEGLGKKYRISHRAEEPYSALRDVLAYRAKRAGARLVRPFRVAPSGDRLVEDFWALRDVWFEVGRGERVGIIGRNGAGKSTLLKILSRITDPSEGRVRIRGRVSSLLEVGTGFHPELSGRENIYLNGAVLGMDRGEIRSKFDEIVAFAEVEKFLDTPVKRYSSGMYVRLAFAVAAHLEPEVLIVDEVLAVGDASFQKRCLGKMESVGRDGRAVLFVSHNMAAVTRLCDRAVLLDAGKVLADGPAHLVTGTYLSSGLSSQASREWPDPAGAPGDDVARLNSVTVRTASGEVRDRIDVREPFEVEVRYWSLQPFIRTTAAVHFNNEGGQCLFAANDFTNRAWWGTPRRPGLVRAVLRVPGNFLAEGRISILAAVTSYDPDLVHALERDAVGFEVVDRSEGDGARGPFVGNFPGLVRPILEWHVGVESESLAPVSYRNG